MLPQSLGLDNHADVVALHEGVDGLHRSGEIADVQTAPQIVGERTLLEIDDKYLPLLPNVHAGVCIGQLDDDPARTIGRAAEVDVAQCGSAVGGLAFRECGGVCRGGTAGGSGPGKRDKH